MNQAEKGRVRLWLRSEKALGLAAVKRVAIAAAAPAAERPRAELTAAGRERMIAQATPAQAPAQRFSVGEVKPPPSEHLMPPPAHEAFTAPVLPTAQKRERLAAMDADEVRGCTRCRLCTTRTQTVFGEGDCDSKIIFIGEGPGETEDQTGRPFVGRAGELLTKMIGAMGLKREQVYIANIVKCRPPNNRVPSPDEVATCTPFLERQIEVIRPQAIVTLGLPASQYMLQCKTSMGRLRGQWHAWRGIRLMPTYHPAYVLRNQTYETRAAVWSDLKQVMVALNLPAPVGKDVVGTPRQSQSP